MRIFIAILALLLPIDSAMAEDQITVTKIVGSPAFGDTSDSADIVIAKFSEKDFEEFRQDAEAVVKLMDEDFRWVDFGPDSSYISVAITLGENTYLIDSWYPLFKDQDTIAIVNGSLLLVETRSEKLQRESQNSDKYKTLYSFLDKIMKKMRILQPSVADYRRQGAPQPEP